MTNMRQRAAGLIGSVLLLGLVGSPSLVHAAGVTVPVSSSNEVTIISRVAGRVSISTVLAASPTAAAALVAQYDAMANVDAEVTKELHIVADPLASQQWQLAASKVSSSATANGVVVAVIDTGVDASHPDLSGVVLPGYDANTQTAMNPSTDSQWHGTFVSGIIAAKADNNQFGRGVAPGALILPVKVCDATGSCPSDSVARGVLWATANGAKVINMSLGSAYASSAILAAVQDAEARGVVVVAAAGNAGSSAPQYPASFANVLSVGAVDQQGLRASFSSYGSNVDLAAPGVSLFSTFSTTASTSGWGSASGTSFSSPMVAGAIALIASRNPTWGTTQLRDRVLTTASAGPADLGGKSLDVAAAIGTTAPTTTAPTTTAPTTTAPVTTSPGTTTPPTTAPVTTTPPITIPGLITPVAPVALQTGANTTVTFQKVPNATSYVLRSSTGLAIPVTASTVNIVGFRAGVTVTFTVQALRSITPTATSAVSAPSEPVTIVGAAGRPTVSVSNGALNVSFAPVAGATSYTVALSSGQTQTVQTPSVAFTGLTNGMSYYVNITPLGVRSSYPGSAQSGPYKPYGAPVVSSNAPIASSIEVGAATVGWAAILDNGAAISNVEVADNTGRVWRVASTSSASMHITRLSVGSTLSFQVRATNAGGTSVSAWSNPVVVMAPAPTTVAPVASLTLNYVAGASPNQWLLSGTAPASSRINIDSLSGTSWTALSANIPRATTTGVWSVIVTAPSGTVLRARVSSLLSPQITLR